LIVRRLYLVPGLCGLFVVLLVVTAPARLLAYLLPSNQLIISGYSGTLWNGSATRSALRLGEGNFELGQLHWRLSPWSLLGLSARVQLDSRWGSQQFSGDVAFSSSGQVRLRDAEVIVDARLMQRWLPVQLDGLLNFSTPGMSLESGWPAAGEGRLVWREARWYGSRGPQPLGDFVLEFYVDENRVLQGKVITLTGPIKARGKVQLEDSHYQLDLRLRSEQPMDAELRRALELMASPVGRGFHLQLESDW
jgi:general secretion pathway protein N